MMDKNRGGGPEVRPPCFMYDLLKSLDSGGAWAYIISALCLESDPKEAA